MVTMRIVIDNGTIYKYEVETVADAREHAHKIITTGFRTDWPGKMRCYPVHRISCVDFSVPKGEEDELMGKYPARPE